MSGVVVVQRSTTPFQRLLNHTGQCIDCTSWAVSAPDLALYRIGDC